MMYKKELLTAVGTLSCAIGIGFIMQNGDAAHKRYGATTAQIPKEVPETPAERVVMSENTNDSLLEVHDITLTSAEVGTIEFYPIEDSRLPRPGEQPSHLEMPDDPEPNPDLTCYINLSATPAAAAMVDLSLKAPCLPNERVTVHHSGMLFTDTTTSDGRLDLTVPALAEDAVFILSFSSGEGAVAQTRVETLQLYDRVALQWKDGAGFQIHAREFGANYGEPGHVWSGAARDIDAVTTGVGGFLRTLGDHDGSEPLLVEVYSFPKALAKDGPAYNLTIEAEVTEANCDREIEAKVFQVGGENPVAEQQLSVYVPACDAIGNFLVLNNLLQNMKVAAN